MKIDFTVTNRDKNLLAGLAVCAAVFCFYWCAVKQQIDCLDKLEVQQEALEMQQLQMQVHIAALPVDEKRDEEQKKQLAELESHFFPYQTNEELNRYLTDVFVSEGMIMQDSTLRAGQLDEITPYSLSERMALLKKNEQAKQTQTGINASADSKKDEIDTKTEYVYSAQADYTAIGTKNQARSD